MSNFTPLLLAVHFAGEGHEDGKDDGENDCTGEQCEVFHTEKNEIDGIANSENNTHCESGADFVDDKMVINCKFTNNNIISQLSADGRFVQAFSTFNPFRCEIFFNVPDYSHPLFINVRNDDCKREIFTVNTIKKM